MGSLSHLPNELVAHLLTFCSFKDVLSCQATCRFLREIIAASCNLQYRTELGIAGLEDNPQCNLSIPDRLSLLRSRERAWALFKPNFTTEIPVQHTSVVVYELSGGSYMLSGMARNSINHLRLPSTPNQAIPHWSHIPVTDELLDFGLAATEHDLTAVLTTLGSLISSILSFFLTRCVHTETPMGVIRRSK
ncbi:hypothetical protein GYMLUDRAFT_898732 [Collybiopsis luxurians FD-317 M1]|uniref:F-box domain-containing protein n=1 Tax=Collybiopsis luxurians FD-317 M1 TaxID=944289 RepID=A0A0D0BIR1_9AGAR|nr:hypothetical protein GYMLUDRAFT_898732 [Collybiopsis luxurians FD-317 M1]